MGVPRRRKNSTIPFVKVFVDRMSEILDADLGIAEWRLLWVILAKAAYEDALLLNVSELARDHGWDRAATSRTLNTLIGKKILVRDPDNSRLIWINPRYAWSGDEAPRRRAEDRLAV